MHPDILAELRRRHEEPHRAHHRWPRIAAMLEEATELSHAIGHRPSFILAVLFHSAVFDRRRPDAAMGSIALMRRLAEALPAATLDRAAALIAAWDRQAVPQTADASLRGDAALLLDLDAAPLGAPPPDYAAYEAALRHEAAHLDEERYAAGRAAALRLLAWRPRIYRTDRFHLALERRARRNIQGRLERLDPA